MKNDIMKSMLNTKISAIAGCTVEVTVLSGLKTKAGVYLTIEIEGKAADAVARIRDFFGAKFDEAIYDEELNYTYAGIDMEK